MRRLFLFLVVPVVLAAGWSIPTTAEGSPSLAPVAGYLHQVAASVPSPRAALFDRVEAATEEPTCASVVPVLRAARPAAAALVSRSAAPEAARKAAAQVLSYTTEVDRLCGATPR